MTTAHPPDPDVSPRPTFGRTLCNCVRFHRPMPVADEVHYPVPLDAPFYGPKDQATVWLCPTTKAAVRACTRVHLAAREQDREPTRAELRPFGRYARALAQVAMDTLGPQADIPMDP